MHVTQHKALPGYTPIGTYVTSLLCTYIYEGNKFQRPKNEIVATRFCNLLSNLNTRDIRPLRTKNCARLTTVLTPVGQTEEVRTLIRELWL